MPEIPVILDGDPGHDDAIAWLLALASEQLRVLAVTTLGGNAGLENTTRNALRILTLAGRTDIPVAAGAARPLFAEPINAPNIHGESGLDGPVLPEPAFAPSQLSAVELMYTTLTKSDGAVLVATGPLTNLAQLLTEHPDIKSRVTRISLMGGGILSGNWTPAAEFNILCDPEAAKIVFESGIPITMSPLDVTEKALIYPSDFKRMRQNGNAVSLIVSEWLEFFYRFHRSIGYAGAPMHDPCAVAALIAPELFVKRDMYVQVETCGSYCRGATIGDYFGTTDKAANASVLMDVERPAFAELLIGACGRL